MHRCQRCDDVVELVALPEGGARCPRCGWVDPAVRAGRLLLVTGASGGGKSTVLPLLRERLAAERVAIFDVDWLIGPIERAGRGEIDWDAFRDAWLHMAHGVTQNGLTPILLGPFFPQQLEDLPGRAWIGDVRALLLDCDDDERRARMAARPAWRARDVDAQVDFGRALRGLVPTALDTTHAPVSDTAEAVAAWARLLV